jgi:hypothetical protein
VDLWVELFRLGTKLLDRRALEPIIAVLCLYFTAMFVEIAGKLDANHLFLYGLCVLIAVATGSVGLGGLALYAYRTLLPTRVPSSGRNPTPD